MAYVQEIRIGCRKFQSSLLGLHSLGWRTPKPCHCRCAPASSHLAPLFSVTHGVHSNMRIVSRIVSSDRSGPKREFPCVSQRRPLPPAFPRCCRRSCDSPKWLAQILSVLSRRMSILIFLLSRCCRSFAMPIPRSFHSLSSALNRYSFALLSCSTSTRLRQLRPPRLFPRLRHDFDVQVARTLGRTRPRLLRLWTWPLLPAARAVGTRLCTPLLRLRLPPAPPPRRWRRQKTCWERKWRHVPPVQPQLRTLRGLCRRQTPWRSRRSAAARVHPTDRVSHGPLGVAFARLDAPAITHRLLLLFCHRRSRFEGQKGRKKRTDEARARHEPIEMDVDESRREPHPKRETRPVRNRRDVPIEPGWNPLSTGEEC